MIKQNYKMVAVERIVKDSQCEEVDNSLVDMQTANRIKAVWDNLIEDSNKDKFQSYSIIKMADVAWKLTV